MEKVAPNQEPPLPQHHQNEQGFNYKCPRCDSSNTKFCYYNNYSLSQPRHYCKACKRYWTRGGTLRNVPVGGRCRKNKRPKRPSNDPLMEGPNNVSPTSTGNTTIVSNANPSYNSSQTQVDLFPSASNHINPLLFGVSTNPSELNLPFPKSKFSMVSSMDGFDQLNALGLGFSSGNLIMSSSNTSDVMATATTSIPLLPTYSSIFGSSSSSPNPSPSPTMAALLASSFLQQKETPKAPDLDRFQTSTTTPLEGMQMDENSESRDVFKGVEHAGQSKMDWTLSYQNQLE